MSFIKYSFMFLMISGWSFVLGFEISQDYGLDHCRKAGWEFIDDTFSFAREKDKKTYTKQALKEVRYLQSKMATKCIIKFKER